uniref:H15 domain-containing protein n=1 Tax=Solanum tuberosum TaxID=4113 RepID=M1CCY0_SOLTU
MAEARLATTSSDSPQIRGSKRSIIRLENLIMEAISNLKEPGGSNKTTIATYIEFSREADVAQAFAEAAMKAL